MIVVVFSSFLKAIVKISLKCISVDSSSWLSSILLSRFFENNYLIASPYILFLRSMNLGLYAYSILCLGIDMRLIRDLYCFSFSRSSIIVGVTPALPSNISSTMKLYSFWIETCKAIRLKVSLSIDDYWNWSLRKMFCSVKSKFHSGLRFIKLLFLVSSV